VSSNGLLSFGEPNNAYMAQPLPANSSSPFIAPFWTNVDTTRNGRVYYRQLTCTSTHWHGPG